MHSIHYFCTNSSGILFKLNCKHGTEATFMVFGVLKFFGVFNFCCMKKPSKKHICFTNAYLPSALLCEFRFPEVLFLMGKTGNAFFEEKNRNNIFLQSRTRTLFLELYKYVQLSFTLIKMSPGFCPWKFLTMTSVLAI